MQDRFYLKFGKRIFDIFGSFLCLLLLMPLFLIVAILVKFLDKPGPVFFMQERIGKNFSHFSLIKFRTMVASAEKVGPKITRKGDPRITKIGKFLRRTKIDELPQLINVMKGEMSLVGPRPEVERYVKIFIRDYEEILKLSPGITDYAAIKFRNEEEILENFDDPELSYIRHILPTKIKLYRIYLRKVGFITDLSMILKTLIKIFQ